MAAGDYWPWAAGEFVPSSTLFNTRLPQPFLCFGGWQCPGCGACYSPSVRRCPDCPAKGLRDPSEGYGEIRALGHPDVDWQTGQQIAAREEAELLGRPCPPPAEGGLCGCGEADDDTHRDCLRARCDH